MGGDCVTSGLDCCASGPPGSASGMAGRLTADDDDDSSDNAVVYSSVGVGNKLSRGERGDRCPNERHGSPLLCVECQ